MRTAGRRLREVVDPDGSLTEAEQQFERRRLTLSPLLDGMTAVEGLLDSEAVAVVSAAFAPFLVPAGPDHDRTPAQRRADALVEVAAAAIKAEQLPQLSGAVAAVDVVIPLADLVAARGIVLPGTGGILPGAQVGMLACDAAVGRILLGPDSLPLDVGRAERLFTPAQRRALAVRDRGCRFPGCTRPARHTEAHHLVPWLDGGPTDLANDMLLCATTTAGSTADTEPSGPLTRQPAATAHLPSPTEGAGPSPHRCVAPEPVGRLEGVRCCSATVGCGMSSPARSRWFRSTAGRTQQEAVTMSVFTPGRFAGTTAIVTGAGSGIGRATAIRLAQEGARVVAADISLDRLEVLTAEHAGLGLIPVAADLSTEAGVQAVMAALPAPAGVLANVAGIMDGFLPAAEVDDATWQRVFDVNVTAVMRLTRAVLPGMLAAGAGSIVNVSSEAGIRGGAAGVAYTASKHAVNGYTRSVAVHYRQSGIRCNAVLPGGVITNVDGSFRSAHAGQVLGPVLQVIVPPPVPPEDIAATITYVLSTDASNMNGAVVTCDGGWAAI